MAGKHAPSDQRVGGVGEAGEHQEEIAAPVRGEGHAEPGHAVQDHEGGASQGEGGPDELAAAEPLPEEGARAGSGRWAPP